MVTLKSAFVWHIYGLQTRNCKLRINHALKVKALRVHAVYLSGFSATQLHAKKALIDFDFSHLFDEELQQLQKLLASRQHIVAVIAKAALDKPQIGEVLYAQLSRCK